MDKILDFFQNPIIYVVIATWLVAQFTKFVITFLVEKKLRFERLFGDGGMPSCHSATVTSLFVLVGWYCGFSSPVFAITFIFSLIVMHDAMGVRRETGKQAASIKELAEAVNGIFKEKDKEIRTDKLKELVGHTPLQVFFGIIVGAIVAVAHILGMKPEYASLILQI